MSMSLRDKIQNLGTAFENTGLYEEYGVLSNPFPPSNQTSDNPHYEYEETDEKAETEILSFIRDKTSKAVVLEGTQGVGKTNFLKHFEEEIIKEVANGRFGHYVVRYLADPENTFDSTIRYIFQNVLGLEHLRKIAKKLREEKSHIDKADRQDVRSALHQLARSDEDISETMMEWLLGLRLLKTHKEILKVQFRLDTVESKTTVLRDIVEVSISTGTLSGIFLLLDELEKQDGTLGPRAVVRYLSAIRAIIDALPRGLFLMIAVTPDALRRYSVALPALRARLQNRITLSPLKSVDEAAELAQFYVDFAQEEARRSQDGAGGNSDILTADAIKDCYDKLSDDAPRRGDDGVRQREFLHRLYTLAETVISAT